VTAAFCWYIEGSRIVDFIDIERYKHRRISGNMASAKYRSRDLRSRALLKLNPVARLPRGADLLALDTLIVKQ
jgi:hypothetical protein